MICPRQDGELQSKKVPQPDDRFLEYDVCPSCHGSWLRAFDANFLKSTDIELENPAEAKVSPSVSQSDILNCPVCGYKLTRAIGASIPENILAFHCPNGHGYFFPAGELSKFKVAQEAKIAYHRTWNIPLTSVATTLLMTFLGIILSVGLILGVVGGQQQQNIVSEAQNVVSFQRAYPSGNTRSVTFIVGTTEETTLTLHINETSFNQILETTDHKSHVLRVTDLNPGTYTYYFTFEIDGRPLRTETYSFIL